MFLKISFNWIKFSHTFKICFYFKLGNLLIIRRFLKNFRNTPVWKFTFFHFLIKSSWPKSTWSGNFSLYQREIFLRLFRPSEINSFFSTRTIYIWQYINPVTGGNKEINFIINKFETINDCNGTRTHNHFVYKRTLKHLAKPVEWLNCVVSTYLYSAFDCMFLSGYTRVLEWIHTLHLSECQGTPCSKQAQYLKFKWLQRDSNGTHNGTHNTAQSFGQFG